MTSPLAGSLARTIGKALAPVFLPATLTRGGTLYPCRGIYEQWGKGSGPGGALTNPDVKALLLANSLAVEPNVGDVVTLQGSTFVVVSNVDTKQAVSTDPARATWSLIGKFVGTNGLPVDVGAAYADTAAALGSPFALHRSTASSPLATPPFETLPAVFTNAKASGFSFTKGQGFEDVLWTALIDGSQVRVGDYLVGASTYFIASMPPLLPITAVQCNRTISLLRDNSQIDADGGSDGGFQSQTGSKGTYWGQSRAPQTTATGVGERTVISGIPCAIVGTAGRATGTGENPSGPPGPGRWRIYMPQSAFPKGSIKDADILIDEESRRYMVGQASWTNDGYRVEAVTEEVQG